MDGRTVAVARGAVDDGWLGIMAVEVDPGYRRHGLAAAVMAALWGWGERHGADRSYVQVEVANVPALQLYTKLGYSIHHEYHYRSAPAS
jgi:GNAT superfamily N-acetyltransferase